MKVLAKCNGVVTEHDIARPGKDPMVEDDGVSVVVHDMSIKIEVPEAHTISAKTSIKCLEEMSHKAWVHISTGPLFQHFFGILFRDNPVVLPDQIKTLLEDYDEGVIQACGLIVEMVEARFNGVSKIYLDHPDKNLHPACARMFMSMIHAIQKIPLGSSPDMEVVQL